MEFNSTLDLVNRAVNLYDGLKYFLTGMLGQNSIGGDILKITHDMATTVSFLFAIYLIKKNIYIFLI